MDNNKICDIANKIGNKTATKVEKDELMQFLTDEGRMSQNNYDNYRKGHNVEKIMQLACICSACILLKAMVTKLNSTS